MTCVVGYKDGDAIYLGSDSYVGSVENGIQHVLANPEKIFQTGQFLIGVAGSMRIGQLLHHGLRVAKQRRGDSDQKYLVINVMSAIRSLLQEHCQWGSAEDDSEVGMMYDTDLILAYKNQIYMIDVDLQVQQIVGNYVCIGSGREVANGAMFAFENGDVAEVAVSAPDRIKLALQAATHHQSGILPPYHIMQLKNGIVSKV
jgi:ATP-dependent protease HslVU (ClpYQ) peptidase subunit